MRTKLLFVFLSIAIISLPLLFTSLPPGKEWIPYIVTGLALVLLLYLLQSVIMPHQVVMRGIELIAAQDFNNRLIRTGEHESDRIVCLFNNMIDRLRNERLNNMERENFLHLLIEASPMGVVMLDFDEKVKMVNDAFLRITGISSREELTGSFIEDSKNGLVRAMLQVPLEQNNVIRDGDVRMYRCYHLSFLQMGFRREFFLLETLTEEVMRAERAAYEKVIRTISHEVNNTMGGVRSVLEILLDYADEDELTKVLKSCDNRCDRLCGFVNAYADVVRIPDAVKMKADINAELDRLIPFMNMSVGENIKVQFDQHDDPLWVNMDCEMMEQVWVNIVKNAAESIGEREGHIWITTYEDFGKKIVEISNDGDPIPEDVSRQLFSPFFTTKKEGRGVGLTLTAEILNRHDAYFRLFTDTEGITRFRIEFLS